MATSHRPAQSRPSKLGVGVAPVATQAHIADPSGAVTAQDDEARAAIASILDVLEAFGLTATS